MRISPTDRPTPSPTLWLARGRYVGDDDAADVVRRTLKRLRGADALDDQHELPGAEGVAEQFFEARWTVDAAVTVRARLTLKGASPGGREWVLAAEAERAWDQEWPSPATMFWPDEPDAAWDHEPATDLRLRGVHRLPTDDKDIRRLLRSAVRGGWSVNVVVHEAMTPDERGSRPLGPLLPPGLRHRVLEHRAAPDQLRIVNRALREFGVQVPRGGAVLLPTHPAPAGFDGDDFAVRTVFLDGSRPVELVDALARFVALPPPLPEGGAEAVAALRDDWQLRTLEEELERQRGLVAMYADALEAMTKSRDLYREAAERAHEALAAYRDSDGALAQPGPAAPPAGSPFQQLSRTLERLKGSARGLRPTGDAKPEADPPGDSASD